MSNTLSEKVDWHFNKHSFAEMNQLTRDAIKTYGGDLEQVWENPTQKSVLDCAWKDAHRVLSKSTWKYEGDPQLDDTADNNFFTKISIDDRKAVLAGVFGKMLEGASIHIKAAHIVRDPDTGAEECELKMSVASVVELKKMVPLMELKGRFTTAGRAEEEHTRVGR